MIYWIKYFKLDKILTSDLPDINLSETWIPMMPSIVNTLRPRQNGRDFSDDIFKCIFLNENVWILIKISLNFVPRGQLTIFQLRFILIALCRPSDKPLSEPMMINLLTHIASLGCNVLTLNFVPKGSINNIPASVYLIAWRQPGDKPLSEPMMISLLTHICVTRPQWDYVIITTTNMQLWSCASVHYMLFEAFYLSFFYYHLKCARWMEITGPCFDIR